MKGGKGALAALGGMGKGPYGGCGCFGGKGKDKGKGKGKGGGLDQGGKGGGKLGMLMKLVEMMGGM